MATYELKRESNGIWAYRIKKTGVVSKAGSMVSSEEAERMVACGEGRWHRSESVDPRKNELYRFAQEVRRTGLTHGRDQDVQDAVRLGYLSVSDAMNTDD